MQYFRIHGDNIVECERIVKIIISETKPEKISYELVYPSTIAVNLQFTYLEKPYIFHIEMLPGFNKSGRKRWDNNIFSSLKKNGSFLEETPDAIITKVEDGLETILFAVEFCSALQAGNQAWQRNGRAYSTSRAGCPYIYIVEFVKYELDSKSRERKILRFPNPIVPYSYINYSKIIDNFVAQIYIRSEEFDKLKDKTLTDFDENNFAEGELSTYIVKKMCSLDTKNEEIIILKKNFNIVLFLSEKVNKSSNLSSKQWKQIFDKNIDLIEYSVNNNFFNFHKKISSKSQHGQILEFLKIVDKYSIGLASKELPFGIIPANKRKVFSASVEEIFPSFDKTLINKIGSEKSHLILCVTKGFKPKGDDNRPDRGLLPLIKMLSNNNVEIMTYIFGPIYSANFELLKKSPDKLADSNGLWKSILTLSDYVAIDSPILEGTVSDAELLLDTSAIKDKYVVLPTTANICSNYFKGCVNEFHEDDVDTCIHFLFAHLLKDICFEGMCNPPGGDWSGISIVYKNKELRWLSLPRVSEEVSGKRPDHVIELFGVLNKPLLLSIESKERSKDLEMNVGISLINYIKALLNYAPSVEKRIDIVKDDWKHSSERINISDFSILSAAAYLKLYSKDKNEVFSSSMCDILFILEPTEIGWNMEIIPNTAEAEILKSAIRNEIARENVLNIKII